MSRVDEFDEFYASTSDNTLKATYAVCGDRKVAFDATVDAYRHAWRDWPKIRQHKPDGWVRTEAWRLTYLNRSTHPLRHRNEEDADGDLLKALAKLKVDDRRLLVLMTLGGVDLEDACREVGIPSQQGAESAMTALGQLESSLVQALSEVEERMHALGQITRRLMLPAGGVIRHRAQLGQRRNTILLIAASVAVVLGAGFLTADPSDPGERQRIGDERRDFILTAQGLGPDDLLPTSQISRLDPNRQWKVLDTNQDEGETTPYASCPPRRFANPDTVRVAVRTFSASQSQERAVQAVEIASNPDKAEDAYKQLEQWFGDCRLPGVQLRESWVVRRPYHDFRILQLVSHQEPEQTFTVGIGISGRVVSTLVHRASDEDGPDIWTFARVLNGSVAKLCRYGGERCADGLTLRETPPPATAHSPEFLAIADLPAVSDATGVWSAVKSDPKKHRVAAVCDDADFAGTHAQSRSYVQARAVDLSNEFGITESVGTFATAEEAKAFVGRIRANLARCPDKNLAAQVDQPHSIDDNGLDGTSWRVQLDLPGGEHAQYRTSIIRNGATVGQVTFTGRGDIDRGEFERLAQRAGDRLGYKKP